MAPIITKGCLKLDAYFRVENYTITQAFIQGMVLHTLFIEQTITVILFHKNCCTLLNWYIKLLQAQQLHTSFTGPCRSRCSTIHIRKNLHEMSGTGSCRRIRCEGQY